jgi:hypothetical protein
MPSLPTVCPPQNKIYNETLVVRNRDYTETELEAANAYASQLTLAAAAGDDENGAVEERDEEAQAREDAELDEALAAENNAAATDV